MSHHPEETIICPNCGSSASGNYCSQCGQETHLHKDTFIGLILHFVGHYFHYDSKFWQTMRALWFSPGLLTTAYWEKKRMRYIPPVSLYIFISFVYFFTIAVTDKKVEISNDRENNAQYAYDISSKSMSFKINIEKDSVKDTALTASAGKSNSNKKDFFNVDTDKLEKTHPHFTAYLVERIEHYLPRIFFFMIPFMAFIMTLLFIRRKELSFINHTIFSLHFHSLWFSVNLLSVLYPFGMFSNTISVILIIACIIYLVKALKNVYHIKRGRAILYTFTIGFFYLVFFCIVFLFMFLFICYNA